MTDELKRKVDLVCNKYLKKFKQNKLKNNDITEYEIAIGFNKETRCGSKSFNNTFGKFMEEIIAINEDIKYTNSFPDFTSNVAVYELKSKYNTEKEVIYLRHLKI